MNEKLTATITFHCTPELKALLTGIASSNCLDLSSHCREVLERDAEALRVKVMMQYELFGVPQKQERM
jgi:hypothetical protein